MAREQQILAILNDGNFHSGEDLALRLGISRAAVWKIIQTLEGWGVDLHAVRGRGYQLAKPLELLQSDLIWANLTEAAKVWIQGLEIHQHISSTNTYLMESAQQGLAGGFVCLAESQSAGRGRQGRCWISPFAANLYFSVLWRFSMGSALLSGLSLATGIAVARGLESLGISKIGLKWPNDLVWQRHKLGGILLEFGGESSGPCFVVAGVGLNISMPRASGDTIDQPWVDLRSIAADKPLSRNRLAAALVSEIATTFASFEEGGFSTLSAGWSRYDSVAGQPVRLQLPDRMVQGIARGVDESGALLLETEQGIQRFLGGEISLRPC